MAAEVSDSSAPQRLDAVWNSASKLVGSCARTFWTAIAQSSSAAPSEPVVSKYPPAKPGALRCEPLKAAYPGGFGAVSHLLRGMRHQVPKLTILKHAHLDAPLFAAA